MKRLVFVGLILCAFAHADNGPAVIYVHLNSKTLNFKSPHIHLKDIPVAIGRKGYRQVIGRFPVSNYQIVTDHHTSRFFHNSLPTTEIFYLGGYSVGTSAYNIDEANIQEHTTHGKIVVAKAMMDVLLNAVHDAQTSGQQIFVDVQSR